MGRGCELSDADATRFKKTDKKLGVPNAFGEERFDCLRE
jgi:hypothetical protein